MFPHSPSRLLAGFSYPGQVISWVSLARPGYKLRFLSSARLGWVSIARQGYKRGFPSSARLTWVSIARQCYKQGFLIPSKLLAGFPNSYERFNQGFFSLERF